MKQLLLRLNVLILICWFGLTSIQAQDVFLIKDINPGVGWAGIDFKFRIGDQFYFVAGGDFGDELWVSDGTPDGTVILKDIDPDPFSGSDPQHFIEYNGVWYFTADDGVNGNEIWKTDGTFDGTTLAFDLNPGDGSSSATGLTIIHNKLYFAATDGDHGVELWQSDGTVGGTFMVADIFAGIASSFPNGMTALGNNDIAFVANDGSNGNEIWKSDGTAGGTSLVKDINAGAASSTPTELTSVSDKVYFIADDGMTGKEVWRTDGTEMGTVLTADISPGATHPEATDLNVAGDYLYFVADAGVPGVELFRSDANAATALSELVEIFPDTFGSTPNNFFNYNDDLYFNANSGVEGFELWKAEGSDGAVNIVKDINPGFGSSSPKMLIVFNNELYFRARGDSIGFEIWKTDGTEAGTVLLGDLNTDPGTDISSSDPNSPMILDGFLYFSATDYINGYQIWRTDGNSATTQRITDIPHDTLFNNSHKPYFINLIDNTGVVNFVGLTGPQGEEMWGANVEVVSFDEIVLNSPLDCNGDSDGSIDLTISGGVGDTSCFTYAWSEPGLSGLSASGLDAGNYTITITDCAGFTTIQTFAIEEPAPISGTTNQVAAVSCNGSVDGQANVVAAGGNGMYTYVWDNNETGPNALALNAGIHTVTITDQNGCTGTAEVLINEPSAVAVNASSINEVCFGANDGQATAAGSGGTSPYTYLWDNNETGPNALNLTGGIHTVTVTDANGCTSITEVEVPELENIIIEFESEDVSCLNGTNGTATASAAGGAGAGFTYSWDDGPTGAARTSLAAGTYCVTVTDANACTQTNCVTISETTTAVSLESNVSCNGLMNGSATVNISNPTSNYTFAWDNGETGITATMLSAGMHTVTITDDLACTAVETVTITAPAVFTFVDSLSASPSCFGDENGFISYNFSGGTQPYDYTWSTGTMSNDGTLSNLGAGAYSVTVTDANNCETFVFNTNLTEPDQISASLQSSADVSCFDACDGSATINIATGTPGVNYNFTWSTGETSSGTSSTANELCMGQNTVTISDGTCTVVETYMIAGPAALSLNISTTDVSCNGGSDGSVDVDATGGTAPYMIDLPNGGIELSAGTYQATLTDNNNCVFVAPFTITEPTAIEVALNIDAPSCIGDADGSVEPSVNGGTSPYTFQYEPGVDPDNLSAGSYMVTVTDFNDCTQTTSFTVENPSPVSINNQVFNVTCNGAMDGSVFSTANGGTSPYTFDYSDGQNNLSPGIYNVTATDANGCVFVDSFEVVEPDQLLIDEYIIGNVACFGDSTGSAEVVASGGTAPYTFEFPQGSDNLPAGMYEVTVVDANGCETLGMFSVEQPAEALDFNVISITSASCFGGNDGSVEFDINGGTAPYTVNGETSGLSAGIYEIEIIDANNCITSFVFEIFQPDAIVVTTSSTDATGTNADGTASVDDVAGGTAPYTYEWNTDPVQTTSTATDLPAGEYTVTVTDDNGCTSTTTVTVNMITSVADLDEALYFDLFPNPASDIVKINFVFEERMDVELQVLDVLGRIVAQVDLGMVQANNYPLDVSKLEAGVYWIKLSQAERHYVRKISVIR